MDIRKGRGRSERGERGERGDRGDRVRRGKGRIPLGEEEDILEGRPLEEQTDWRGPLLTN